MLNRRTILAALGATPALGMAAVARAQA